MTRVVADDLWFPEGPVALEDGSVVTAARLHTIIDEEMARIGACTRLASAGQRCEMARPAASGTPSSMATSPSMCSGSSEKLRSSARIGSSCAAQKATFSGVATIAPSVESVLIDTDSAALPRARWVKKLEMWPAGQDDTSSMPSAIEGVGRSSWISPKVKAGNSRWWLTRPMASARGVRSAALKSASLRSSAMPNITSASTRFKPSCACGLKFSRTWSMSASMGLSPVGTGASSRSSGWADSGEGLRG